MRSFVVTVGDGDAELAADRLWQLGVRAVEERSAGKGRVELWTAVGEDDAAIAAAAARLEPGWSWRTEDGHADWPETWRDHVRPLPIGLGLLVVPAWLDVPPPDVCGGRVTIVVEPGAAFGLGDHPTTALCLWVLEREMAGAVGPAVLDVGCGTGVLAIAAAKLGARRVRAVDVSFAAVEASRANTVRNDVEALVEVDSTPVFGLRGSYDLVVANLLAPALIDLAGELCRLTSADGRLVVSGILDGAHDHVLDALRPMVVERTDTEEGWAAVTLVHRGPSGRSASAHPVEQ